MMKLINFIHFLVLCSCCTCIFSRVNKFVTKVEKLDYDPIEICVQNVSREIKSMNNSWLVNFVAFDKSFKLLLNAEHSVCNGSFESHAFNQTIKVTGKILTEQLSAVNGWMELGLFYGVVKNDKEIYHVESAKKYFLKTSFHSIMYRCSDENCVEDFKKDFLYSKRESLKKVKRSALTKKKYAVKICPISLEADYTFLEMAGSISQSISLMVQHIQAVNEILQKSFLGNKKQENEKILTVALNQSVMQFQIAKIRVYNMSETYRVLVPGGLDSTTFLRLLLTKTSFSRFCLALFFTARSYIDGVLGVAYPGGVCTPSNVGVVSFVREGMLLPPLVTRIVVAQVVGQAFGAKVHDDNCEASDVDNGDYIMTRLGVTSERAKNILFSRCSVEQITSRVNTIEKSSCMKNLQEMNQGVCGNGLIEKREECDCGDDAMCGNLDPMRCCNALTCQLRLNANCSPSNGFCCDAETCDFKKTGEKCSNETECLNPSVCSGNTSVCPKGIPKENYLECRANSSVCVNGVCSGSLCLKLTLAACFCEAKEDECKICCIHDGQCMPLRNITMISSRLESIYLNAGALCRNRRGYCDMFHDCHEINANTLFSGRYDPYSRKRGIQELTHSFWWAIFLATIALLSCVVVSIKHVALYTRSDNPALEQAQPTRRLPQIKLSRLKENEDEIILSDVSLEA